MAQKKTKVVKGNTKAKSCEEYVLNELYDLQQEYNKLFDRNQSLEDFQKTLEERHIWVLDLVKRVVKGIKVEKSDLIKVSIGSSNLYYTPSESEEKDWLKALIELVEHFEVLVEREGEEK